MDEIAYPTIQDQGLTFLFQENIDKIEKVFDIHVAFRHDKILISGESTKKREFKKFLKIIQEFTQHDGHFKEKDFDICLNMAKDGKTELIKKELLKSNYININGKDISPKTLNQKHYLQAVDKNDIVFCIGPAGTGKTFLAIALALQHLLNKDVERIVLTRPVVEAGEKLGFLPGDIQQKVNPYFRPLYDALYFLLGFDRSTDLIDKGIIEIAPLAYMRGRTINNSFIILDEGQNTLNSQMKMFLTRLGQKSQVIITADITQIDLDNSKKSGIFKAIKLLKNIKGIEICYLTQKDVIRHPLVEKIIEAYEEKE